MDGWMDEWIDEWMNGWMDGWIVCIIFFNGRKFRSQCARTLRLFKGSVCDVKRLAVCVCGVCVCVVCVVWLVTTEAMTGRGWRRGS